ncbi:MAG TPA: TonB-dependent receptor [Nevskiaceae bacterium]|nr:TonB-dependent receptor [Nevskiaceae bacterium]
MRLGKGCAPALLLACMAHAARADEVGTIPVNAPEQTAAPAEAAPGSSDATQRLEDVVVTATKRPQKLRDIPQSITALNADDLERRGVQNLQDIVRLVPGVNLSYDAIAPRVTIRGISQSTNTSPTAGAIFGNVSFADAYLPVATLDANPFDLETVEVLKGPQGTLFGSSNLNGAIRYVPKAPEMDAWQTKYYGQYTGIQGAWAPSYGAVVNAPLFGRDDMALRVMAFQRESPGYVDVPKLGLTDTNEQQQKGARAMLAWRPGDWDVGVTYAYQRNHSDNVAGTNSTNGQLADTAELRLSPQAQAYHLADLSLAYDFGWGKFTSESSGVYKAADNFLEGTESVVANSPIPLASQPASEHSRTYCQEFRLASPSDASADWHWLAGALLWKEIMKVDVAINIDPLQGLPLPLPPPLSLIPGGLLNDQGAVLVHALTNVSAREQALFGEVTRRFFDRLEITLGGRYYRTLSGGSNVVSGLAVLTQGTTDPTSPTQATIADEIPEHGFNPKLSVSLHETRNVMTYAAVSRGYRVGGVQYGVAVVPNPQSPVPRVFKSDTIWNYEGGVRTEWFDKVLRFDLTGYLERWKNPQYYTIDATNTSKYLTNVGGVKSTGAEAALQFITPWGIMFSNTAAYSKTVTTEIFKAANGNDAPVGSPWPYSPKWQTASTVAYLTSLGNWNLNSAITYTYMGKAISDLSDMLPVYGFRQLDLALSVENGALAWLPDLELSLSNALDERAIGGQSYNDTTKAHYGVVYIQPRTLNLRLVGHF